MQDTQVLTTESADVGYPPALGEVRYLTDTERADSLARTLAARAPGDPIWVFGYGSLIWRPDMAVAETVGARVHGYHRGLCLWSRANRGTPEAPGLVLALDKGGSCAGVVHRLDPQQARASLESLWQREMVIDAYTPAWLTCTLADGRRVPALSFVIRHDAPGYAGRPSDALVRRVFERASGRHGTTREYVERTVEALAANGIRDLALEGLLRRCAPGGSPGL